MIGHEIPAPPISSFFIGPLEIHLYAICILCGILVAGWLGRRRFVVRGGDAETFDQFAFWMVLAGILGARLYHVVTDHQLYFASGRNPWQALNIRNGGLGIWGGVLLGALTAWLLARRHRIDFGSLGDVIVPGLLIAQGMGRLGNWFNQELFGRPSTLPWALHVEPAHRPPGYEQYATFHPTFLYEMLWVFLGAAVLLRVEHRYRLGRGKLLSGYIIWYTFGRFFIEAVRIDPVNQIGGFRLNNYVALILFIGGVVLLVWQLRNRPGVLAAPFGSGDAEERPVAEDGPEPDDPAAES